MRIHRDDAVAVVDHDAVAIAAVRAGVNNVARAGRHNGRAHARADIQTAVVCARAGRRRNAVAEAGGNERAARHRPLKIGKARRRTAAGASASAGIAAAAAGGAAAVRVVCRVFRCFLRGALADRFLQRLLRLGFLFGDGVVFRLRVVGKRFDVGDHGICRLDLCVQLCLLGVQLFLQKLLLVADFFVAFLDGLNILARRHILFFQSFVVVHDVVNVADAGKKLGHAGGIEDEAGIGIAAVFLHRADAGTEKLRLRRFLFQRLIKLRLLFGNDLVVDLDLLADKLDHLAVDFNLSVKR